MRVVVTIQHPAHVHFFRHAVAELRDLGHEVSVFAREKEVAVELLEAYGVDHEVLAGSAGSLPELAAVQLGYEVRLLRRVRRIDPDAIVAVGGVAAAHVGAALGVPSVVFYDTEHASLIGRLAFPFADVVCTPDCYDGDLGRTHRRYPSYHELAYLHPDRFTPDPAALDGVGLEPGDSYVVLRLVEWGASHDVGHGGVDDAPDLVARLERAGARVLVTAESGLPDALEPYRVSIAPEAIHHLLYYADAFVGEGATMAAESAVLGTPAVYVNSLSMGYTNELESHYGLLFGFDGAERQERAREKAVELVEDGDRATFRRRRERLLDDKVDATDVVVREVLSAATTEVAHA